MSHHSVSGSRGSSPRISVEENRPTSVSSFSGSLSSTSDSSTSASASVEFPEPIGRFDAGLGAHAAIVTSVRIQAPAHADVSNGQIVVAPIADRSVHVAVPLCPTPVRRIIQSTSVMVGSGGLGMAIFGGVRINDNPIPELDPNRGQNIALMACGMLLLIAAVVAFMATQLRRPAADEAAGTRPD